MYPIKFPVGYELEIPNYKELKKNLDLTPVAKDLLNMRYLKRDREGYIIEDAVGMFWRVAKNIASADKKYGSNHKATELEFFKCLVSGDLVPASPILMNAGNNLQHLFSDHALDVPDSLEDIFDVLKISATIQQHGGGCGFSFSRIRPRNDEVSGMKNVAFGPLSVMKIFDTSFSAILQGGRRSGANMAILHISHPDVYRFIEAKNDLSSLQNFNLSVAVTDEFMEAVLEDREFNLINPRNNVITKTVNAKELFESIAFQAWKTGDPGVVFIDEMNRKYPFSTQKVLCTGSCGQYELESFEGVPYMHINLSSLVSNDAIHFDKLKSLVRVAVHFLDNCVDMHSYTHDVIERKTKQSRKIGLGVLGFADLLFSLKISYGSQESLDIIRKIMVVIQEESRSASHQLALQRGSFPLHDKSTWKQPMRHATITSIAPTGSTSMISGTSQSIEPVYAFSFTSKTSEGAEFTVLNKAFKTAVDSLAIDRVAKIQLQFVDSVQNISWLDSSFKKIFRTAMDVSPMEHLSVMATFQEYVDNSISKTINLPRHTTVSEVQNILIKAYELGCKGITMYRDGCRDDQALNVKTQTRLSAFEDSKI